ncbi:MAG: lactate utilization protein C [Rhodopila sp.]
MNPRDSILAAVRSNRPAGEHALPPLPRFPLEEEGGRAACFARSLTLMGGKVLDPDPKADLLTTFLMANKLPPPAVICSMVSEIAGNRDLATVAHPRDLADVDLAVVRAACAVAETGSVLLTEAQLQVNAVAYLAQHLLVLLDPADIVAGMQDAYDRPEFHEARYAVFHTGPSATADIEGVLVHGAQGVRSLTVAMLPRPLDQTKV